MTVRGGCDNFVVEPGDGGSEGRAFSADTGMAEVMVVATKRDERTREAAAEPAADYVTLDRAPEAVAEAVEVASAVARADISGHPEVLRVGSATVGWAMRAPFGADASGHPSGVSEPDVASAAARLAVGELALPRHEPLRLPTVRLGGLGLRGPYHADINGRTRSGDARGPFDVERLADRRSWEAKSHPVLWSHDHEVEAQMTVLPCSFATPRRGQTVRALALWTGTGRIAGAGRLHVNRDWQVNSQPTAACLTPADALGGRAWPSFAADGGDAHDRALCVWLNSTLGMISRWYHSGRQQRGRSVVSVTSMMSVPVVDLRTAGGDAVLKLGAVLDEFEGRRLLPGNEAYRDDARIALDRAMLCEALGLPDSILGPLGTLRLQWCSEPSVHGGKRTQPAA